MLAVLKATKSVVQVTSAVQLIASLLLFVMMLSLVKEGIVVLAPALKYTDNGVLGGLGVGWIVAMLTLNGSAVAATSVALFNADVITVNTGFGMIHGSRLGAGFMVLLLGVLYQMRGANRKDALSTGVQTLLVAQTVHLPAFIIGYLLLARAGVPEIPITRVVIGTSILEFFLNEPLALIETVLPGWTLLPIGFAGLLYSFSLFDKSIKSAVAYQDASLFERLPDWFYYPVTLFLIGLLVTAVTLSVSISLALLTPLIARGIVHHRYALPYIMGAGVSTFIDTYFAASLLQDEAGQGMVLMVAGWVALVSLLVLLFAYPAYERLIERLTDVLLEHNIAMKLYLAGLFLLPLGLIFWRM
ncbi:MAG: hypothetical protein KJ064_18815 [Anaerolineae bacterium]|nr:hypothetical protein [Anaerolineae bacterium]